MQDQPFSIDNPACIRISRYQSRQHITSAAPQVCLPISPVIFGDIEDTTSFHSMSKKYYYLAPTRESPPDGRIALGNIIASISQPEDSINEDDPLRLPPNSIITSISTNWKSEKTKSESKNGGVWAGFLEVLGVGGQFNVSRTNSQTDAYEFDKLTTTYFVPTKQYIEEAISNPDVKDWMVYNKGNPLYMITGVKVASGAKFVTEMAKERGFRFQVGVNASMFGVPVQAGPNIDILNSSTERESSDAVSDFVFAFRVREVRYKKKTGVISKDFVKGAMYGLEATPDDDEEEDVDFEIDGLAERDPKEDELDFDSRVIDAYDEDGSGVECVIPEGFYIGST